MTLPACQRLAGADDNRVARVHADRVYILHIADGDDGVVFIPHYLILYFLIALD